MNEILTQLREAFPTVTFDGGEGQAGYWMTAKQGDWYWERHNVTSCQSMLMFVTTALAVAAENAQVNV